MTADKFMKAIADVVAKPAILHARNLAYSAANAQTPAARAAEAHQNRGREASHSHIPEAQKPSSDHMASSIAPVSRGAMLATLSNICCMWLSFFCCML